MSVNPIRSNSSRATDRTRANPSSVQDHTLLRLGSSGAEVRDLQKRLKAAGFDGGSGGKFTQATAEAVRAYQAAKGLTVDGLVGQQTWGSFYGVSLPPGTAMLKQSAPTGGVSGAVDGMSTTPTQRPHTPGCPDCAGTQFDPSLGPGKTVTGYINGRPSQITLQSVGGGQYMRSDAARNFVEMQKQARAAGVNLTATSGFRSMEQQQALYQKYLNGTGNLAARPGYSNHQGGVSMDIGGVGSYSSKAYNWLKANAARFGFVNDVRGEYWHWTFKR